MKYLQKNPLMIFLTLIIILFILYLGFYYFAYYTCNFANPGLFGDFIGGVLGTILTAIAAIFVYRTYHTQRNQVESQKEEFELRKKETDLQIINNLYDKISKDIDDLEVTFYAPGASDLTTYKGIYVLYNFSTLYHKDNSVLNQLALILISFEYLFELTDDFKRKWNQELSLNQDRNYLMFYTKVLWPIHKFYRAEWNKLTEHPDTPLTKARFEKLSKESLKYLLQRQLIGKPSDDVYVNFVE